MKLTNLKINDLITPDAKLTFLVGAGCSIDPPSCLSAGKAMMDALIDYTCAESEIDKIKELKDLRFEQLVEIVRDYLDKGLKVIDYYGTCDKPNLQHFFLAEMIKKGNFVITTNFDFLIEYALLQSEIPKEEIVCVITKEDFENYDNPQKLYSNRIKILYKIHGSTMNILKPENERDTRSYLVTTIQAFGSNKEGDNIFQLESFKRPAFINLTRDRTLVVMGYSGSDDFDIVPTLRILKDIQDVIWINYVHDDGGKELIYEIKKEDISKYENLTKVDQILADIKRMNYVNRVFRVDVNTTRMVNKLISIKTEISMENFSLTSKDWLENNIETPSNLLKYHISYRIYYDFDFYDNALKCSEKVLQLAKKLRDKSWEANALSCIGDIYRERGRYDEALELYEEALKNDEQLGNLLGKALDFNNIGMIYRILGQYDEAIKKHEEALKITEQLGDLKNNAIFLNNIGSIYEDRGRYDEALKQYEKALQIDEQLGNMSKKAIRLNNIGLIYRVRGKYNEALKRYEEALKIADQLGVLKNKAIFLNNIGGIYKDRRQYDKALEWYEEALKIADQIGDFSGKAADLNNIGSIHYAQKNYPKAIKRLEEALQIDEQLGDLSKKAIRLNNIGMIYKAIGKYDAALERCEEALKIHDQLGELSRKAMSHNNIGLIYGLKGNYNEALKWHEKALKILISLGLSESPDAKLYKENIEFVKSKF
jgi:tetratricopeptide (TPR) repeat protein